MSERSKSKGNLRDADGVTTDDDGNIIFLMEVLRKGGSGTDRGSVQTDDTNE